MLFQYAKVSLVDQITTPARGTYVKQRLFPFLQQVLQQKRVIMLGLFCLFIGLFLLKPPVAFAQTNDTGSTIVATKHSILTIEELEQQGLISQSEAQQSIAYYIAEASRAAGHTLTLQQILATPDPTPQTLTSLQEFAGTINFLNVILLLGSIATVGALGYLFQHYVGKLLRILKRITVVAYEAVFYAASLGCGVWAWFLPEPMHSSLGLCASLLFAGALGFSANHHKFLANIFRFSSILFLVWTSAALFFDSSLIGFIAIGALLSALGFSIIITPLCYGFGFRDKATVGRTTLAAFLVLILFIALRLFSAFLPVLSIFAFGALFLGSFVGYTGLLISSSRWYKGKKRYWLFQIVTILAGIGALFFGSVLRIDELLKIGGTFFVLYCLEKLMEVPTKSKPAFALLAATVGIITICFCWFALSHQELLQSFLFIPA
jgi:hypothetical protein